MGRLSKRISRKHGLPPGSLVHVGEKKTDKTRISVIDYDLSHFDEKEVQNIEDCFVFKDSPTISWINIDGLHEVEVIEKIGACFDVHPLVLEDILNTDHRPKLEDLDNHIFFVVKMLYFDDKTQKIQSEQISLILGKNFVLSFQESIGDVFNNVRERIRNGKGRIRKMGADYLLYTLFDAIIDNYFIILEKIGERVEGMDEDLISNPTPSTLQEIYNLKREMIYLRKSVWPLREVINSLLRDESKLVKKGTNIFIRDLYDHTIQVIDTIETYRDMVSGMIDMYMSSVSNKMNEVMKVLTIFAAIFIPLTFIAGIYGMNFDPSASPYNMPELGWVYGYPMAWIVLISVAIIMLVYFKRKKWL